MCVERDIFQFIMNGFFLLKRPFIWLARFRHRCGYGVHSPFAFDLITNVIYERTPYYAYSSLEAEQKKMSANSGRKWKHESKKVNRLLFRLVNYIQPDTIVDAGTLSASSLYLQAGHAKADYVGASDLSELFLEKDTPVDFCICTIIGMRSLWSRCLTFVHREPPYEGSLLLRASAIRRR